MVVFVIGEVGDFDLIVDGNGVEVVGENEKCGFVVFYVEVMVGLMIEDCVGEVGVVMEGLEWVVLVKVGDCVCGFGEWVGWGGFFDLDGVWVGGEEDDVGEFVLIVGFGDGDVVDVNECVDECVE